MRSFLPTVACRFAFAICSITALAGCWRPVVKPAPPVMVAAPTQVEKKIEEPQTPVPVDVPPAETPPVETRPSQAPPAAVIPTERMLLLSPQGPLVVEFEVWIDGQPQAKVFDQLLDEVLKLADSDGDGQPMWKEVTTSPKFRYGQFGNLPIDRENAPKQILQQYDLNGNGQVDRSELPRFLTRNAGGARAFSVRSIEQYHNRNRRGSPAWQVVDADNNGELSAAEIQAAAAQLRLNDADDDEIIVVDELRPTADVDPTAGMRTRGILGDFARLLGEHANWDSIRKSLEQQYAGRGNLGADDFRLLGEVFQHLDQDKDGKIGKKELPALNQVEPHLRFRVEFGAAPKSSDKAEDKVDPPPLLKLISSRLTVEQTGGQPPEVIELSGRVILRWPGVALTFVRNDTIATMDYEALAQQGLTMYDADANGYLETQEVNETVQAQFARFEALDSDADGKVYAGEISAFLRQRQGAQRAQVHARASDQEDALYQALDQNADERLDAQELDQAAARLLSLDASGDGKITSDELSAGLAIVIARGSVENPNQLFVIGPVEARAPAGNLPTWFTAMDTSQDGVISAREFLGSAEKFAALDVNQNGFFEPSEIPAVETKTVESTAVEPAP